MSEAPELVIFVRSQTLTDGSVVYNVHINDLVLPTYGESEARELGEALVDLIDNLTTTTVGVIFECSSS